MKSPILLTGCTGYVGGRLRRVLEERGHALRCMARQPERLAEMASDTTEVIGGDVLKPESLEQVFEGVETAF